MFSPRSLPLLVVLTTPVHATPGEFENGVFTLKTRQKFPVLARLANFENATVSGHFGFVFEENWAGKSRDYRGVIVFRRLRSQNVFRKHFNAKPGFSNFSCLKSVFCFNFSLIFSLKNILKLCLS